MSGGLLFRWSKRFQLKKARGFLSELENSNSINMSEFVCHVYHIAAELDDKQGWDFFEPERLLDSNKGVWKDVGKLVEEKRKMKDFFSANALYVWDITLLGTKDRDFHALAKAMWAELERGFIGAELFADAYLEQTGIRPKIDRLGDRPRGLG